MDPLSFHSAMRPERKIQNRLVAVLEARGWDVNQTHGNMYQCGFPDVYAFKEGKGQRWIEVKVRGKFSFTKAQLIWYPKMLRAGIGIWVLFGSEDEDIALLDRKPNLSEIMGRKLM